MQPSATRDQLDKVADLIKDIRIAFLTTVGDDGKLHSRPMGTQQKGFDGTLWFFTHASSKKVDELQRDQQVAVTYSDPGNQNYVAIAGSGQTLRDRQKAEELWHPFLKVWFPKGLEDPDLALLRVDVQHVEYWDAPSSTFVHLYGLAKVALTGRSPNPGEHESFDVRTGGRTN
jgi:general stress protein 26